MMIGGLGQNFELTRQDLTMLNFPLLLKKGEMMYVTTHDVANDRYVLMITRACCPPGPRNELLKLGHSAHKMHVPAKKFKQTD